MSQGHELSGRLDHRPFLGESQVVPDPEDLGMSQADGFRNFHCTQCHCPHQQVHRHHDEQGDEDRPRNVPGGILDLLAALDDDFVSLERDIGQSHCGQDSGKPLDHEGLELVGQARVLRHHQEPRHNEPGENHNLEYGDEAAPLPCFRGPLEVHVTENQRHRDGQDFLNGHEGGIPTGEQRREQGMKQAVGVDETQCLPEIVSKTQDVKAAGHRVREPAHPSGLKPVQTAHALFNPEVASAGFGKSRPQLGV